MMNTEEQDGAGLTGKFTHLSICIGGRDDDYMLDFKYRITTTINHISRSLKQLGRLDDVEILVTDWGSHIPLAQTLNLSPEAARITRFIYVPPEVIRDSQNGKADFHASRAFNVAIRRASGTYVLFYNADTLISQYSLDSLLRFLKGEIPLSVEQDRTFFLLPRLQVPWQFLERQPNLEDWDRYLLVSIKSASLEPSSNFMFFGGAGALLMHRSMWYKFRGVDEFYANWGGSDRDLGFRVTQYHSYLSLSCIGIILYHMEHPPTGQRQMAVKNSNLNSTIFNVKPQVNSENWGLGDIDLDFQYTAVHSEILSDITPNPPKKTDSQQKQLKVFQYEIKNTCLVHQVKKTISSFLQNGWKIEEKELNALFLLAWYSNYRFPRKYIEFATGRTPATGVVAVGCPSVEIFKVDTWEGTSLKYTPYDLSFIYEISPYCYCGYLRFINGDINTAIQRLRDSFIGPFIFDLCLINEENLGENILEYIDRLLPYMAPGGALVFISCSRNSFTSVRNKVQVCFPDFTFISCTDNKTGMILADSLMNDSQKITLIEGISFDPGGLILIKVRSRIFHIIKKGIYPLIRKVVS